MATNTYLSRAGLGLRADYMCLAPDTATDAALLGGGMERILIVWDYGIVRINTLKGALYKYVGLKWY